MKRILTIAISCLLIASAGYCLSDTTLTLDRDPFEPQLPKKEIKVAPQKPQQKPPQEPQKPPTPERKPDRRPLPPQRPKEIEIKPPALRITGLIWNSDRPQAIVNNQVIDVGDTIETAKIVAIHKTGIDIVVQGKTMTISP